MCEATGELELALNNCNQQSSEHNAAHPANKKSPRRVTLGQPNGLAFSWLISTDAIDYRRFYYAVKKWRSMKKSPSHIDAGPDVSPGVIYFSNPNYISTLQ